MGKRLVTKYGSCFEDKDGYWCVGSFIQMVFRKLS